MSIFYVGFQVGRLRKGLCANITLKRPESTMRVGVAL